MALAEAALHDEEAAAELAPWFRPDSKLCWHSFERRFADTDQRYPYIDPMCRVALLPRRFPIRLQNRINELLDCPELGLFPLWLLALRRQGSGQGLTD
jgi:hypothetical protein